VHHLVPCSLQLGFCARNHFLHRCLHLCFAASRVPLKGLQLQLLGSLRCCSSSSLLSSHLLQLAAQLLHALRGLCCLSLGLLCHCCCLSGSCSLLLYGQVRLQSRLRLSSQLGLFSLQQLRQGGHLGTQTLHLCLQCRRCLSLIRQCLAAGSQRVLQLRSLSTQALRFSFALCCLLGLPCKSLIPSRQLSLQSCSLRAELFSLSRHSSSCLRLTHEGLVPSCKLGPQLLRLLSQLLRVGSSSGSCLHLGGQGFLSCGHKRTQLCCLCSQPLCLSACLPFSSSSCSITCRQDSCQLCGLSAQPIRRSLCKHSSFLLGRQLLVSLFKLCRQQLCLCAQRVHPGSTRCSSCRLD